MQTTGWCKFSSSFVSIKPSLLQSASSNGKLYQGVRIEGVIQSEVLAQYLQKLNKSYQQSHYFTLGEYLCLII